jgi:hypothetical protein
MWTYDVDVVCEVAELSCLGMSAVLLPSLFGKVNALAQDRA